MRKQGCAVLALIITSSLLLAGCLSEVLTGANLVYDRHNIYKTINDFQLSGNVNKALYHDKTFKRDDCNIDVSIFNRDVLLVGEVPTAALREEAYRRASGVPGKRRLFNQVAVGDVHGDPAQDSWITAKIRSQIFADSDIDPHKFKVVTFGKIIYLMGDVEPEQAAQVIMFARQCAGVTRVVKLFKYYNLSDQPATLGRPE